MKKLLYAVSALAALSLLAPSTGLAEATNILGLFADEGATTNTITGATPSSTHNIYVVVINPYNENQEESVAFISGVEFGFTATNGFALGMNFAVANTDVGGGIGNHIAGFGEPLAVTDGMAVVATMIFLYSAPDAGTPAYLSLNPATPSTIADHMACVDFNVTERVALLPPFENFDYNVFSINGVVSTEDSSLDQVKAMYR